MSQKLSIDMFNLEEIFQFTKVLLKIMIKSIKTNSKPVFGLFEEQVDFLLYYLKIKLLGYNIKDNLFLKDKLQIMLLLMVKTFLMSPIIL